MLNKSNQYAFGYRPLTLKAFSERSAEIYADFLLPHLRPNMSLLDCGCGPASITLDFAKILNKGRVVGIDLSLSQVEKVKKLAKSLSISNIFFEQADIARLPFECNEFDVVYTNGVLCYVSDIHKVMNEIVRVLKPGGILALSEPDYDANTFFPNYDDTFKRSEYLRRRGIEAFGGDFGIGKKLRYLLYKEKFINCTVNIYNELFDTPKKLSFLKDYLVQEWDESLWAMTVLKKRWATKSEVRKFKESVNNFSRIPAAFYSFIWIRTLGYKPYP